MIFGFVLDLNCLPVLILAENSSMQGKIWQIWKKMNNTSTFKQGKIFISTFFFFGTWLASFFGIAEMLLTKFYVIISFRSSPQLAMPLLNQIHEESEEGSPADFNTDHKPR